MLLTVQRQMIMDLRLSLFGTLAGIGNLLGSTQMGNINFIGLHTKGELSGILFCSSKAFMTGAKDHFLELCQLMSDDGILCFQIIDYQ